MAGFDLSQFRILQRKSGSRGVPLAGRRMERLATAFAPTSPLAPVYSPAASTSRDNAEQGLGALVRSYPWIFPPQHATPFVLFQAPQTVGAGATATLINLNNGTLSIVELPRGFYGIVQQFGATATDFTNLTFTATIRGVPQNPLIAIPFQFGPLNDPRPLPGAGILLRPGDDFVLQVTNGGVGAVTLVQARMEGYIWQEAGT